MEKKIETEVKLKVLNNKTRSLVSIFVVVVGCYCSYGSYNKKG